MQRLAHQSVYNLHRGRTFNLPAMSCIITRFLLLVLVIASAYPDGPGYGFPSALKYGSIVLIVFRCLLKICCLILTSAPAKMVYEKLIKWFVALKDFAVWLATSTKLVTGDAEPPGEDGSSVQAYIAPDVFQTLSNKSVKQQSDDQAEKASGDDKPRKYFMRYSLDKVPDASAGIRFKYRPSCAMVRLDEVPELAQKEKGHIKKCPRVMDRLNEVPLALLAKEKRVKNRFRKAMARLDELPEPDRATEEFQAGQDRNAVGFNELPEVTRPVVKEFGRRASVGFKEISKLTSAIVEECGGGHDCTNFRYKESPEATALHEEFGIGQTRSGANKCLEFTCPIVKEFGTGLGGYDVGLKKNPRSILEYFGTGRGRNDFGLANIYGFARGPIMGYGTTQYRTGASYEFLRRAREVCERFGSGQERGGVCFSGIPRYIRPIAQQYGTGQDSYGIGFKKIPSFSRNIQEFMTCQNRSGVGLMAFSNLAGASGEPGGVQNRTGAGSELTEAIVKKFGSGQARNSSENEKLE